MKSDNSLLDSPVLDGPMLEGTVLNRPALENSTAQQAILELTVKNHSGVMSHVCGLLSRRAYNMEAIICLPLEDNRFSHIWLLLNEDKRLPQLQAQLLKLQDVLQVREKGLNDEQFRKITKLFAK